MRKKYILFYMMIGIMLLGLTIESVYSYGSTTVPFPIPNSMAYPSGQESDNQNTKEQPFENTFSEIMSVNKDDIDNFEKLKKSGTPFLRKESPEDPDSSGIQGYFWDIKNPDDKLQYGGIARIEEERFVNVVAINAKDVSDQDQTDVSNAQNDAKHAKSNKFNTITNPYIGTFIGKHDGQTYFLYGRYANTIIPIDPLDANGNYPVENI